MVNSRFFCAQGPCSFVRGSNYAISHHDILHRNAQYGYLPNARSAEITTQSPRGWYYITASRGWVLWRSIRRYWRSAAAGERGEGWERTWLRPAQKAVWYKYFPKLFFPGSSPTSILSFLAPSHCISSATFYFGRNLVVKARHCPWSCSLSWQPTLFLLAKRPWKHWRILCKTARPCLKFFLAFVPLRLIGKVPKLIPGP